MPKKDRQKTVKVRMTLNIGLANAKKEDTIEYDAVDVPSKPKEREQWLHEEWQEWAWQYIDGGATIEE